MRYVCSAAVLAVSILSSSVMFAQGGGLSITNYQFVSQTPVTLTQWDVTYSATVVNSGPAVGSVKAQASSSNPNVVRTLNGQDTFNFGPVATNGQANSTNTITLLVNRAANPPFDFSLLQWSFTTTPAAPIANAGPNQTVPFQSTVTLDGSASTNPSGTGTLTYSWLFTARPPGSLSVLIGAQQVHPTFVADAVGNYTIQLTVSNGTGSSSASVTVSTVNSAPVANAGANQTVTVGSTVALNGSGSTDVDGDALTYAWTLTGKPLNSNAALIGATTSSPSFVADLFGIYTAQLIVNDGHGNNSPPAFVTITTQNTTPVAKPGANQTVNVGSLVQLNGSGSTDVDGDSLTYQWSFNTYPTGSAAPTTLSSATAVNPTFTADLPGTYVVQLIVTDNHGNISPPATVTISTNQVLAPTANAGPNQSLPWGTTVQLNGSGTDPQGLPLTYHWSLTSKPTLPVASNATLTATIPNPTFVVDVPGQYIAQLIVSNGFVNSPPAVVTINSTNTPPVASAGPNQNVVTGATVTLDGTGSSDPDHNTITYAWSFLTRPGPSNAILIGATTAHPVFVADVSGTFVVQLIVSDPFVPSNPATVTITAAAAATITLTPNPLNLATNAPGTLTVSLSAPAGNGGQLVGLSSNNTAAATVPANVTIPQGNLGANVTVTPTGVGTATITASGAPLTPGTATVNVATPVISLGVDSPSLAITHTMNGTITLSAPAPTGGITVSLSSLPTGIVTMPPSVTVGPGVTTGTFTITGAAVGSTVISASSTGYITGTANVGVGNLGQISLPSGLSVGPNQSVPFAVGLTNGAPVGGVTITLSSGDTTKVTISPASVFIAEGATAPTTQPQVTGVNFGSATITASGSGFVSGSQTVQVSASLNFPVQTNFISTNATQNLTLNLMPTGSSAPAGGLTINLSSSNTSAATVPTTVFMQAGASSVSVPVTAGAAAGSATIHASDSPNLADATTSVSAVSFGTLNMPSTLTVQAGQSATLNVSLPSAAPTGGVTVTLSSTDSTKASVTASVFIAAGATAPTTQPQVTGNAVGSPTINASAPGFASASTAVTVAPGPAASVTATAGATQSAAVNTAFATPLQATVKDSGGNPVGSGTVVTFTVVPVGGAGATFPGSATQVTANTNASGVATAPALTANAILGSYTVTAVVSGATSASFALTNTLGSASSIAATSGTPQTTQISTAFAAPLVATVKDSGGNPVGAGTIVTFTVNPVSGASGTFAGNVTTATTNASGVATASTFTANTITGSYTVTASITGGATATFSLTNSAGNASSVTATSGTPQTVQINNPFAALVATVKDASNNPVSGATVTFTAPVGGASGSFPGSQSSATATTNANGVATAPAFTANATAGSYNVTAAVTGASSATYSLTNSAGTAASVTATGGTPQTAQISTAFAAPLVATVKDSGNNPVSGVVVTFTAGTVGPSGAFAGNPTATATTNASGVATSPTFTANTATGSYTVTASASGASSATYSLTNSAGNAASVTATSGTPQSAQVSTAFAAPLVATVKDSGGNPVSGVTVTFTAGTVGATGTFAGNPTATATTSASGVATSPTFTANATAGPYTVTASVTGASSATFSLTNTAGTASSIAATGGTPQTAQISTAFAVPLVATVKDSGGNGVSGVTVTFTVNPLGGASGAFAGNPTTTATTNASGVATASTFTANTVAGTYTVTASMAGGATATFSLTNSAGSAASVTATSGTPQTVQINNAFAALVATVKDGSGNAVSGATVTFSAPVGGASGSFPGSQTSATATTNANGVATAPAFTANATAGSYNVTAAVTGASSATYSLTNSAGTAASIAATSGTPQTAQISTAFAAPMVATAKDSGGNPVSGVTITFTAGTVGPTGTFAGNPTATATTNASGVATAPAFTANAVTGSYTVTASATGATSATFSLTNSAGAPAAVTPTSGTPQTVQISTAFAALQATVKDGNGNLVGAGVAVTFTVTAAGNGASGSFPSNQPSATVNTNASGVATAPTFTANTIAGSYTVTASVTGASSATYSLTNNPGTAASVTATSGTPQTVPINTGLASLVATVKDSGGNPVNNATVTFTVTPAGNGAKATFAGNATTATANSNASGVATAPTLTANATTGSYTVTASVTGATSATYSITNGAGAPATITANSGTGQSATINTAFTSPLVVTVKDSVGNLVSGAVVTFSGPASGASIVTTTATTNSVGVATAPVTANATASPSAYTVTASITGATSATFSLTNNVGPAASVTASAGTPQSTHISTAFATNLQVTVKDAGGNAVGSGVTVTFQSINTNGQPGGTFTGGSTVVLLPTNILGQVTTPTLTANGTPGSFTVTASIAGGASATFSLTNLAGTPTTVVATSGTPQTVAVNTAFAALAATVKDSGGNPVGAGVTVTFTAPASGPTGTFSTGATATATTNASGVATAPTFTANGTPGTYNVTASVTGATSATFSLTNGAGSPASVAATGGTPQSAGINSAFAALQATVKDSGGNGVGNVTVTFTVTPNGASASFSSGATATATTNASGVATAPTLTANGTLGSFTVTASITGGFTATYSLTNIAGAAASVTATGGTPQSVQINTAFASLVATVKDSGGNAVSGSVVTFAVTPASNGASAAFTGGTTATTNAGGVATAPTLTANGTAGTFTVTASVSGASSATYTLTSTPGAAATITANSGTNQSAQVNTAFTNPLVVTVKDSGNNVVPNQVVTFTGPASGASIVTTTATTNSVGVASAPVTANGTSSPTAYTVTASVTGATSATFSLTNLVGSATSVTASAGTPQAASINTAFATQLQASVKDAGGNLVGSGVSVTFTINTGLTGASALFSGGSTVSITSTALGVATAPTMTANSVIGTFTVTASIAGGASATFSLTNNPGPATSVAATAGTPQSAQVTTAYATALQATVKDAGGNPVIAGTAVTFAITAGGGGASGSFTGSATVNTNANGVAIAPTLTANGIAGTFTVTASIAGGASATFSMTNTAGTAASIAATGGTPQTVVISTNFAPLQATVKDSGGNLVGTGTTVTFTVIPVGGAGAAFAGQPSATANTNASGVATAPTLTANGTAGSFTVTASIAGGASATYSLASSATAIPGSISANAGTPQSAIVGTPFTTQLQVKVLDSSSNPVPNVTVFFQAPTGNVPSGTFPGSVQSTSVTTGANGLATAPIFTAGAQVGTYNVVANVGVLTANFSLTNVSTAGQILITNTSNSTIGQNLKTLITITLPTGANGSDGTCGNPQGCQDVTLSISDVTKAAFYGRNQSNQLGYLSSTVLPINFGQTSGSVYVDGLASSGTVIIAATSGSQIGSATITLAPSGFVLAGPNTGQSFSTNPQTQTTLTVSSAQLDSSGNFVQFQNMADGQSVNVNVASAFTSVGTVSPTTLAFTGGSASGTTTFTGAAPGSTTVTAIPPAGYATPNGGNVQSVTVNPSGLLPANVTVGNNLEVQTAIQLAGGAIAGMVLTVTSNDPTHLLLSTTPTGVGSASIQLTFCPLCGGVQTSQGFYIQGFASSGTATYTASAPNFGSATATVTFAPSGIVIADQYGFDTLPITTNSPPATITASATLLDANGNYLGNNQLVAPGPAGTNSVSVNVISSNTAVGQILTSPIIIAAGTASASTTMLPASPGTTTLTTNLPSGFRTPLQHASIVVTVTQPGISLQSDPLPVGIYLQQPNTIFLFPATTIDQTVTITSNSPNLLLSATASAAGQNSITVTVPAGSTSATYYVQVMPLATTQAQCTVLASSTTATWSGTQCVNITETYSLSAPGFANRTASVTMMGSGVVLASPTFGIGGLSGNDIVHISNGPAQYTVFTAQLTLSNTFAQVQTLAPGSPAVTVNMSSSAQSIGTIVSPITINPGSAGATATFTPLASGVTSVSATASSPATLGVSSNDASLAVIVFNP